MAYNLNQKRRMPRRFGVTILVVLLLLLGGVLLVRHIYNQDLGPVSNDQSTQIVEIKSGLSTKEIANILAQKHLIRSAWAFELYVHSKEAGSQLQAGTYALSPSQSLSTIITTLTKGKVTAKLVTILPGQRIDQVRAALINAGFTPSDVDQALTNVSQYNDISTLAFKPASTNSLEGLLWPDSWYKDASSSASDIVRKSLSETSQHLSSDLQAAFAQEGLTTYQGLVLASMLEKEVSKPADRAQAAQVFLARLHNNTSLGSDVTAIYGAIAAGKTQLSQSAMLGYDSQYNTLQHAGLPPTPISSVSTSSLQAAAHPASTNWLYFVSGDDGNTYFSTNLQDHEALTQKYCHKLCAQ